MDGVKIPNADALKQISPSEENENFVGGLPSLSIIISRVLFEKPQQNPDMCKMIESLQKKKKKVERSPPAQLPCQDKNASKLKATKAIKKKPHEEPRKVVKTLADPFLDPLERSVHDTRNLLETLERCAARLNSMDYKEYVNTNYLEDLRSLKDQENLMAASSLTSFPQIHRKSAI